MIKIRLTLNTFMCIECVRVINSPMNVELEVFYKYVRVKMEKTS